MVGVLMALSTPHRYYAESRLFVDPREIRVTEDDIRNQQLSTEAMLAITDSQLQILSSTSVLEKVIEDLGLDRDPEFNGSMAPGGISGGISLIRELFTGKNPATEGEQKALNNLRDALSVGRDARTFVIIVGVDTRDPEKSALIANQIVETYLDSEGQAQSNLLERTSESIDTRINSLRADLDAAEREVERFKAENGLVGVGGQYIDDKEILALSDQLANARAMKVGIRVKADNLARVKIDDVLSGAFPEELLSSNLSELRKQYAQTKSNAESLATRLGPRHPQYISAMQSLETITNEISAELRRIVASSQTELQRAVETEQELASQMAVAKSRAIDQSVELVTLRELERKANATRGIYEAFLTRSRETSERSNLSTRNVRVISPAEAPLQPMGPSRKFIAIGGMMAGFLAGFGLALLAGAVESVRAYNSALHQARYPGPLPAGIHSRLRPDHGRRQQAQASGSGHALKATWPAVTPARPEPRNHPFPVHAPTTTPKRRWPDRPRWRRQGLDSVTCFASVCCAPGRSGARPPFPPAAADITSTVKSPCRSMGTDATPRRSSQAMASRTTWQGLKPFRLAATGTNRGSITMHRALTRSGHPGLAQPQPYMQPQMPAPYPAQHYSPPPHQAHAQYSGAPQHQPQIPLPATPTHAHHPAPYHHPAQPYPPAYAAPQPGYAAALAGHPYQAQPLQGMPAQPPQFYPQQQPAAMPWPSPQFHQPQPQPHFVPVHAPAWEQPAAPVASAPHQPTEPAAPARNPERPAPDNASVDRIRREMDELRSRIDGYGSDRRRA
ncbi:hypothetical protein OEG86_07575 [Hoeflea alexandrii]|uniref:GNVR domain-containing protein n=1 Tax=Hoeflea alexandrii TaxID=288436 RepID=UPI00226EE617|nr:GNVR domain-containing protein [Hoeflea alexandrii]MCY0152128.1 hypothetical protein [Hoeflea alexandrii]